MDWKQISLGEPTEQTQPDPTETSNPTPGVSRNSVGASGLSSSSLSLAILLADATLAYTIAYATDHWQLPRFKHATIIIALAAGYGATMELGQQFRPHRTPFLVTDVLINTLGASLIILWFIVRPHLEFRPLATFLSTGGDS